MQKQKPKSKNLLQGLMFVLQKLYGLIKGFRKYFAVGLILGLVIEVLRLIEQYLFKGVVDFFAQLSEQTSFEKLFYLIGGMAAMYFSMSFLQFITNLIIVRAEVRVGHYLSLVVFRKHLDLSLAYHEKENTGAKLNKIQNGIESVNRILDRLMWDCAPAILRVIASFVFLVFIDWRMAIVFLIVIPLFVLTTLRMNARVNPLRQGIRLGFEKVYGGFGQAIYNIKTVKAFVQENREKNRAKLGVLDIIKKQLRFFKTMFSVNLLRDIIIAVGNILVVTASAFLAYRAEITPGELVLFISVAVSTYYSLYGLTRVFDNIMDAKVGVERMFEVLDSKDEIAEEKSALKIDLRGEIEFKNVSFDYGDGKVIKNINLKINPGEIVAFVGPSGGGKSTIVKLLYRYYDVQHGSILIDGEPIEKLNVKNYRSQLGIVNQDIDIFNDTIKANIAYGRPRAGLKQIKYAAKIANADEFINKFKKKYDTVVGERGIKLSGGQKQRVGIARAVLVDPKILIFDEATSSLDAGSEKMIQQAIRRVIRGRTTIIIAHRLSTVKNADRIVVIDKGRIAEQGTHKQLIVRGGIYKKLVKLQISGYLD